MDPPAIKLRMLSASTPTNSAISAGRQPRRPSDHASARNESQDAGSPARAARRWWSSCRSRRPSICRSRRTGCPFLPASRACTVAEVTPAAWAMARQGSPVSLTSWRTQARKGAASTQSWAVMMVLIRCLLWAGRPAGGGSRLGCGVRPTKADPAGHRQARRLHGQHDFGADNTTQFSGQHLPCGTTPKGRPVRSHQPAPRMTWLGQVTAARG